VVDAGLPADRRVDLAEQRGRDRYPGKPAEQGCSREAGQVGHHAPTERDDGRATIDPRLEEPLRNDRQPGEVLVLLAVGDLDDRGPYAGAGERIDDPVAVERADPLTRDERTAPGEPALREAWPELVEQPAADHDRIGARAELHRDLLGSRPCGPRLAPDQC